MEGSSWECVFRILALPQEESYPGAKETKVMKSSQVYHYQNDVLKTFNQVNIHSSFTSSIHGLDNFQKGPSECVNYKNFPV